MRIVALLSFPQFPRILDFHTAINWFADIDIDVVNTYSKRLITHLCSEKNCCYYVSTNLSFEMVLQYFYQLVSFEDFLYFIETFTIMEIAVYKLSIHQRHQLKLYF